MVGGPPCATAAAVAYSGGTHIPPKTTSCGAGAPAVCGLGLGLLVCNLYFCMLVKKITTVSINKNILLCLIYDLHQRKLSYF